MTRILTTLPAICPRMPDGESNADAYISMQELSDEQLAELHVICCAQDWHHVATMVERYV